MHMTRVVPLLLAGLAGGVAAQPDTMQTTEYRGIRPTDPGGRDGLWNPERGLRIETLIAEPPGGPSWGPAAHLRGKVSEGYSDDWWLLDAAQYRAHGLTLAQTYCYLDAYVDGPIPEEKLQWLRRSLGLLRENGLKALLRFAYERDMGGPVGPTLDRVLEHQAQLEPIVREYADVIFVMQAGFIGAWGEWHSSVHRLESDHAAMGSVLRGVLDMLPKDRMTQVRVPKYKRWALGLGEIGQAEEVTAKTAFDGSDIARVGFNNDGFLAGETCGGTWPEPPLYSQPGNPEFDIMTRESATVPVDGELFWADQGGVVDGLRAAVRMRLHHYASFSLAHSYSEREGAPYSIDQWMNTPISPEALAEEDMPLSDGYFEDDAGRAVERTAFEYIRDHLGYRIELQRASWPRTSQAETALPVSVELINRGFSVPHNPRLVYLVLLAPDDTVVKAAPVDADPRAWQPFEPADPSFAPLTHTVSGEIPLDGVAPGGYRIGLWLPDAYETLRLDPRYALRAANGNVAWWTDAEGRYGANVLGDVEVE